MTGATGLIAATDNATLRTIADEAAAAFNSGGRHVQSFSARYPAFTLDDAYHVTALANEIRIAKGHKPAGRKAGFTNRQMWKEYGVNAPNWGYVYGSTLHDLAAPLSLAPYTEPKIEPEIMFGLAAAPSPGMDDAALLSCIAWVGHGFEIVQSIFPGWRFSLPDCTAANAMHGALLIGPRRDIGTNAKEWLRTLPQFEVELYCDGKLMERGRGSNVLEGPLSAIRYITELLARDANNPPLGAGEIVSTGTLTRALPLKAGETWTTKLKGIGLEGVSLTSC
jgi:2-keto-4-pentenoate hydratase